MHKSSFLRMEWFVETFLNDEPGRKRAVLDVGSYDVNGSYRPLFFDADRFSYTGLDMESGPNVDIVPETPYRWSNIADDSFDIVVSGQAFEHIEFFWVTVAEIVRVLKPGGVLCIIVPRKQECHRYPVDTYRYDVDGLLAIAKYGGLTPLHASVNLAPKNCNRYWYDSKIVDAMLVAKKPDDWQGLLDIDRYVFVPIDHDTLTTGLISLGQQDLPWKIWHWKILWRNYGR